MIQRFITITSLYLVAAFAAAVEDLPSFFELDYNRTEKVTETNLPKEFTTLLPDLPNVNSCTYPGTCAPLDAGKCQRCQVGFVKDSDDDTKCKYEKDDENPFLLISMYDNITLFSLDTKNSTPIMQNGKFTYLHGVDYSFQTNSIFWFSETDNTIYTAPLLNNVDSEKKNILQNNSSNIYRLTVDWVHNHIYWANGKGNLVVSNFNGTMQKVLFNDGRWIQWSKQIVVNPLSGWMYWTDARRQVIERAGLDGSRREVIYTTDIYQPKGLALDLVENRMYWSQHSKHSGFSSLWSSNFDGTDLQNVFQAELEFTPFNVQQITLFDKYIYLMDSRHDVIFKINKCNGQEFEVVYNSTTILMDIKVYHSTIQPEEENLCLKRIDQCSHFCFPTPSSGSDGSVSTTACACPDGFHLSFDQRNCVPELTIMMQV